MPGLLWFPFPSTSCPYRSAPPESGSWWTFLWPPQETHAGADDYWQIPPIPSDWPISPWSAFNRSWTSWSIVNRWEDLKLINMEPSASSSDPWHPFPTPSLEHHELHELLLENSWAKSWMSENFAQLCSHRHQKSQKRLDMGWIWLWRATCSQHGWEPEKMGSDHLLHYYSQSKVK